jgi:hypothetical protein
MRFLWCCDAEFFEEDRVAFLRVSEEFVEGDDVDVHAVVVVLPEVSCGVCGLSEACGFGWALEGWGARPVCFFDRVDRVEDGFRGGGVAYGDGRA